MAAEDRYRKFVIEYFNCGGNQTQAAINAGYSPRSAYMQGSRLMKNDKVKKLMEEYKADFDNAKMAEEFIVDVEKAFEKLSEMGFEEFTQIS